MSVSELRAKFGATPSQQQNGTAGTAEPPGVNASQSVHGAGGTANRTSGAFGVVLKPTLPPRRGIDIDVNGNNDSELNASAAGHTGPAARSLSPGSKVAASSSSAHAAAHTAAPGAEAAASGKPPPIGTGPVGTSATASALARPAAVGSAKPTPVSAKPSTVAPSSTAVKPSVTGRPGNLGLPRPYAAPGSSAHQTVHSVSASGDAPPLSPGAPTGTSATSASSSPPTVSPHDSPMTSSSPRSPTSTPAPSTDAASASEGGSNAALDAARAQLRRVLQPGGGGGAGRGASPRAAAAAAAAATAGASGARSDLANQLSDSSGSRFQKLAFVAPRGAAPPKPESEVSVALPAVAWAEESPLTAAAPEAGNRAVSLIAPTTEEEELEYDDASSGSGSVKGPVPMHSLPPRLAAAAVPPASTALKPVSEAAQQAEPAAAEDDSFYDDGTSAPIDDDDDTFELYDDVGPAPQLPARSAVPLAKTDTRDAKEALKQQKEEEKKQKAKEKEEKEQRAKEKKERERREKEEQKKEAELRKLLTSFKVSATDQPLCEAIVKVDLLKPGKSELPVKVGEHLFILAKDARGKWLAKNSSGAFGIISESNVTVVGTGTSNAADGAEVYDDLEEVYSELAD